MACSATAVLRQRFDEYSAVMTPTLASMPPMPTPVTARMMPSWVALPAHAEASMPPLMSSRQTRMIAWRP